MAKKISHEGIEPLALQGEQLDDLLNYLAGEYVGEDEDGQPKSDGSLLSLLNITIDDPQSQVHTGDIFILNNIHVLICADVVTDWRIWNPFLENASDQDRETLFCPYPGVFVPLGMRAEEYRLILVQPDTYVCGHILDRFIEINGDESIKRHD